MKRLQISLEPELDDALGAEARNRGVSKAALIRRWIRERVTELPPIEDDPLWELVAAAGADVEPEEIDEIVYGGKKRGQP